MSEDRVKLVEVAEILQMKPFNVSRFLERRGITPVVDVPYRRRWLREDILAARAAYVASGRGEVDERRRESARRSR